MGFRGVSMGSLILILAIIILLFGTKRLRTVGEDLGAAFRSFRKGMKEVEETTKETNNNPDKGS